MRTQTVTTIQSGDGSRVQPAAETSRLHVVVGGDGADIGGMHSHAIQAAYSCEFDFIAGELAHHSHQSKQGQS